MFTYLVFPSCQLQHCQIAKSTSPCRLPIKVWVVQCLNCFLVCLSFCQLLTLPLNFLFFSQAALAHPTSSIPFSFCLSLSSFDFMALKRLRTTIIAIRHDFMLLSTFDSQLFTQFYFSVVVPQFIPLFRPLSCTSILTFYAHLSFSIFIYYFFVVPYFLSLLCMQFVRLVSIT
jgi:hypothetical protein